MASIVVGSNALGASHFAYARGTAIGVALSAHVAMYKVRWSTSTAEILANNVLAGMDQAIADGVDVMPLSLALPKTLYFENVIAITSLSAIEKGIVVVCAAGNEGARNTTFNGAPWIITVGAGTIDRNNVASLNLENGLTIEGTPYFLASVYITNTSIYYGKGNLNRAICNVSALDSEEIAGKAVLCDKSLNIDIFGKMKEVKRAGGYAGIFVGDMVTLDPQYYIPAQFSIPSLVLHTNYGASVKEYVTSENNVKVKSMKFVITTLGTKPAPQVAFFSSRGPDPINPGVLKPDILAPWQDVLAIVVPKKAYFKVGNYNMVTDYGFISGTSMATPHVIGVTTLLKVIHHDWSPAAIRLAIMTTANTLDNTDTALKDQLTGLRATPLDFGAGRVNLNKAMNLGLIYNVGFQDYVDFLCRLGYNKKQMSDVLRRNQWSCNQNPNDLNYPSFIAIFPKNASSITTETFNSVMTNMGDDTAIY
ncbi:subtilisin-like protease SBT1.6 [Camellia sinensis]|uniref:subtilisin-like protease SBT1.6 n=1 Tax=Camellia sinensis TaxID=4442 RepID=UPI001035F25A|nr:subtilisin-like protease SBT1.6 [Camellia sinensis]